MNKHVLIIGLPGSGKTLLSKKYEETHQIHDDFLNDSISEKLENDLANLVVCANDPRLCNINIFKECIMNLFPLDHTHIILFENDPTNCIANIKSRHNSDKWIKTIQSFSQIYNPYNPIYHKYSCEIIPVYKQTQI